MHKCPKCDSILLGDNVWKVSNIWWGQVCVCVCAETIHNWMADCLPIWWVLSWTSLLYHFPALTRGHREGPALSAVLCTHLYVHVPHAVAVAVAVGAADPPVTPEQLVHVHFQLTAGHLACMQRAGLACDPRTDVRMYIRTYGMWYSRASCLQTRVDDSGGRG